MDTLLRLMLFVIVIVVGFWGVPILQNKAGSKLRTIGFAIFWGFGLYLIGGGTIYVLYLELFAEELSDDFMGNLFLASIIISSILAYFQKLPFMKANMKIKKQANQGNIE